MRGLKTRLAKTGAFFGDRKNDWTVRSGQLGPQSGPKNTVRSGKKRSGLKLEMETDKKTGPYSPVLWDRSLVRSFNGSDRTVQSSLRPNRLVGFTFLGDLEHVSVTPKRYS